MGSDTRLCRLCKQSLPSTAFEQLPGGARRHVCESCRGRRARGTINAKGELDVEALAAAQRAQGLASSRGRALNRTLAEIDRLRAEVAARDAVGPINAAPIPLGKASKHSAEAVACIVLSDWHVDETVLSDEVYGLNEFNPAIAKERAEATFRNALFLVKGYARDSNIKTLHVTLGGDFFSGWIHEEGVERNSMTPVEAAAFAGKLLSSGLRMLMEQWPGDLVVDAVVGNHGRLTRKLRSSPVGTSLEGYMYRQLADALRPHAKRGFEFAVAPAAGAHRRFGDFNMRIRHGYEVRYKDGVGGIGIPLNKAVAQWDRGRKADLTVMGHWHQLYVDYGRGVLVNGSMVGFTPFSDFIKASPEPPRQAAFLIHAKHGFAMATPIWCDRP